MKKKTIIIGVIALVIVVALFLIWNLSNKNEFGRVDSVSWEEAIQILNSGEVKSISQTHSLTVTLFLKTDRVVDTKEPKIDDILREIEKCDLCKDIQIATE